MRTTVTLHELPSTIGLTEIVEKAVGQLQKGEAVDIDALAAAYPQHADELRDLLPTMCELLQMGQRPKGSLGSSQLDDGSSFAFDGRRPEERQLGDFRILREIGRGGMGTVFEAEQLSMGRRVALKILPFAALANEKSLQRFRNEVRAAAALDHPHIVSVYSIGEERGVHYYAMQLIRGQTLAELIEELRANRDGQSTEPRDASAPASPGYELTPDVLPRTASSTRPQAWAQYSTVADARRQAEHYRSVARLGIQAAEALQHAHDQGVLHRDIKPGNLLLDLEGDVYIADFGLARIEADVGLTMTGDLLGTLRYMAPEQAMAKRVVVDHRADVYSLGATLYELLTLQPAFPETDRGELLRKIADEEPQSPRAIERRIPMDLETIVLKAMAKSPIDRFDSAQSLADDLRRVIENKPIQARRPSLWDRVRKWTARHAALAAVSTVALVVVAAVSTSAVFIIASAYEAEARQRSAAEANLGIASQIIDAQLSRVAKDRYWHGDLALAEQLAMDATRFYEELLNRSDDHQLQLKTAEAYGDIARVWQVAGRYEQAAIANHRANELLMRLITGEPGRVDFLVALAVNCNQLGQIDWLQHRPLAAEPWFRQGWEIFAELAEQYPANPAYQAGMSGMLGNLGSVCYFSNRYAAAEEFFARAEEIEATLPEHLRNTAEGIASQAGSLSTQAELARLRGQYDRALELLQTSIPLHEQSLQKWPSNPVALECFMHTHWNIIECHLNARRPVDAAAAAERFVKRFPDRVATYHQAARQLLRAAQILEETGEVPAPSRAGRPASGNLAAVYRARAGELVEQAKAASQSTPDHRDDFARFLLTCEDLSLRDSRHARDLARGVLEEAPSRAWPWYTLALAEYRLDNLQEAEEALQKSVKLAPGGEANGYDWLLLSLIRLQQNRPEEARKLVARADKWIAELDPSLKADVLMILAAEARSIVGVEAAEHLTKAGAEPQGESP